VKSFFVSASLQGTDSGGKRTNYCSTTVEKEMGVDLAAGLEFKTLIPLFAFSSSCRTDILKWRQLYNSL